MITKETGGRRQETGGNRMLRVIFNFHNRNDSDLGKRAIDE